MTREDLIFELKKSCSFWLNNKTISKKHALECLLGILEIEESQSPLPSNLDEAAEISDLEAKNLADDYTKFLAAGLTKNEPRPIGPQWMKILASDRFKAGAEWMAGQGVNIRGRVLPGTHGNSYVESDWFDKGYGGLSWNDEVELTIRKK